MASDGMVYLEQEVVQRFGVSEQYVQREIEHQREEIKRRVSRYRGDRPAPELAAKTIVLVDDGVATGATTLATLRALRRHEPKELILAVPVAPPGAIATLSQEADRVVCPLTPDNFWAVGAFYRVFGQTSDEEVIDLLRRASAWPGREEGVG